MLPHNTKKGICKSSIIPKASSAHNGNIKKKLKSLIKCPNNAKKRNFQYQWKSDESTLILDFY